MSGDFERELAAAFAQHLRARPRVMYCPRHPIEAYPPRQLEMAARVAKHFKGSRFRLPRGSR